MRLDVLFFAQLAESCGARHVTIELADGATVTDALAHLGALHPAIAAMDDRLAVSIDERYAPRDAPLRVGQTLALIPPVSGG